MWMPVTGDGSRLVRLYKNWAVKSTPTQNRTPWPFSAGAILPVPRVKELGRHAIIIYYSR